jgi:hypothetical protein
VSPTEAASMPAWMEGESPGTPMVRAEARGERERRRRRKEKFRMGHSLFGGWVVFMSCNL